MSNQNFCKINQIIRFHNLKIKIDNNKNQLIKTKLNNKINNQTLCLNKTTLLKINHLVCFNNINHKYKNKIKIHICNCKIKPKNKFNNKVRNLFNNRSNLINNNNFLKVRILKII